MDLKKLKRMTSVAFAFISAFSMAGCFAKEEVYFSDYNNRKEMYIGVFSSPLPTLEAYEECAEAGFNYVLLDEDFDCIRGSELKENVLDYCNQAGLNGMVMAFNFQETHDSTVDATDYTQFSAYGGSFFFDEPYPASFDYITENAAQFQMKYSDKLFMCNLHPCTPFLNGAYSYNGSAYSYENYLTDYKTKVLDKISGRKMLSVDIYPLISGSRENDILDQYLYNLEATAKISRNTDIETHYFIMTHGFKKCREITSVADIMFQYYTAMAYGVQGFSAFTYKQQKSDDFVGFDGIVNWEETEDGYTWQKTEIYDYVKEANEYLRAFENVYLSFDWKQTMAVYGTENKDRFNACYDMLTENASKLNGLKSVSATQDTLIGEFLDNNNTKGYMVTNFSEPSAGKTNEVTLTLEECSKVRIYQKGEYTELAPKDGIVSLTLAAGEGAFVLAI